MQQTFPASREPRVIIENISGDLSVRSWDQPSIGIETDGPISELHQEGDALMISNCQDDLALRVPSNTEIRATNLGGDVAISNVRRAELLNVNGDAQLEHIGVGFELANEAILITNLASDLVVTDASSLRVRERVDGDVSVTNVALIEIENIGGDASLKQTETVVIGSVGDDLTVQDIADALSCGSVGGDFKIEGSEQTDVTIGNAGGDLVISRAASVHLGSVGGDCVLRDVQGVVEIGNVGSDASLSRIGGSMQAGNIGGDASLKGLQGSIEAGSVGGDLVLEAAFPTGSSTRLHVGGDALVRLPDHPDLNVRAAVGGDISGPSVVSSRGGNWVNVIYGNGAAQLELSVGGDLRLHGGDQPSSSSSSGGWQAEFQHEMAELGREMSKLGQELSSEITSAFKEAGWAKGSGWANDVARKIEEQMRRAQRKSEEQARKAEERARKAEERGARVRVRFHDREWQLDPERLERIKEQASRAANEGISGALEAVERAVSNLRIPTPPRPPVPPTPPPPMPNVPPVPPMPPTSGQRVQTGPQNTNQQTTGENTASQPSGAPDLEQEREAILRMIAEGRISPEEGDLLLEGLGA